MRTLALLFLLIGALFAGGCDQEMPPQPATDARRLDAAASADGAGSPDGLTQQDAPGPPLDAPDLDGGPDGGFDGMPDGQILDGMHD